MKLKQFQNLLEKEEVDQTILFSSDSNITYFTQVKPSQAILVINPKEAHFHLSKLDQSPQKRGISVEELKKDWKKDLSNEKVRRIGVNEEKLTYHKYQELKKIFPRAELVNISDQLKQLRSQKTTEEIKKITAACNLTSKAFQALIENYSLKKFKTEAEVAFFLERYIRKTGAELAFPTIVSSSKNSSIPHHKTSSAKLSKGFIQLDFGACYQNYCADMSRVLYLGKITKGEKENYELLLQTQIDTIHQVPKEEYYFSLEKYARNSLGKYSSYFIHSLGHGVGIDIHEQPSFNEDEKQKISNNQVFTIEPGIYFPHKYGLRIEDTLLYDKKIKLLTKSPKNLIRLK
ncbi:MAG: Xaa-Pro peptidase family protein [Nanoarchaeota archaeon]|nr:Xaa-Pro peptidase family protein [Nanoarchaeota archaeon]MBU1643881.1 Xaa-Pro peptidase family protein [Nanoarchaeota archaeon]